MNKNICLFLIVLMVTGCYKEKDIVSDVKLYDDISQYDTLSSNPVLKYVSKYYYDNNKFIITSPNLSHYVFNFETVHEIKITPHKNGDAKLNKGLENLKTCLIDKFPPSFIKKYFPLRLLIADSIFVVNKNKDFFIGNYFIALATKDLEKLSTEDKEKYKQNIMLNFFLYTSTQMNPIDLSDDFYSHSIDHLGLWLNTTFTQEELYDLGVINAYSNSTRTKFPGKSKMLYDWFVFLLSTPESEIQEIITNHKVMKINYNMLVSRLSELGIDYKKLKFVE